MDTNDGHVVVANTFWTHHTRCTSAIQMFDFGRTGLNMGTIVNGMVLLYIYP
jgi:hypothetical protein